MVTRRRLNVTLRYIACLVEVAVRSQSRHLILRINTAVLGIDSVMSTSGTVAW